MEIMKIIQMEGMKKIYIRTERSEVCASWPRAKYFPVQPDKS